MQVDNIGLAEHFHTCDVGSRIGDIDLEQVALTQPVGKPDDAAFPQEVGP